MFFSLLCRSVSNWDEWEDRACANESRNWGWSDSPEPEHRTRRETTHRNFEDRGSERRRGSRSDRRRDESERSSSRSSRNESDSRKRESSSRRSRRKEVEKDDYDDDDKARESIREENASRKREKKSRKRRSGSDEEMCRNSSVVKESKAPKRSRKVERDRHSGKNRATEGSNLKPRVEEEVSDENVDANSNNSCKNVEKSENSIELQKCNSSSLEKDSRSNLSSPTEVREKKIYEAPTHKNIPSAGDSQWDTTDSEGEEKSKDQS